MGGRDPSFAGAGWPENDDLGRLAKGVEIVGLGGIERLDRGQRAFDFEFGVQEIYDLGGSELALVAAFFPIEVLTQGPTPSGGLEDERATRRPARRRGAVGNERGGARGGGEASVRER